MGDISFQEYSLYAACVLGLMLAVECLAIWVGPFGSRVPLPPSGRSSSPS